MTAATARLWAAPRYWHPILAAVGDQVHLGDDWHDVEQVGACPLGHRPDEGVCTAVAARDVGVLHLGPSSLLWLRREVR